MPGISRDQSAVAVAGVQRSENHSFVRQRLCDPLTTKHRIMSTRKGLPSDEKCFLAAHSGDVLSFTLQVVAGA